MYSISKSMLKWICNTQLHTKICSTDWKVTTLQFPPSPLSLCFSDHMQAEVMLDMVDCSNTIDTQFLDSAVCVLCACVTEIENDAISLYKMT